MKVLLVEDEEFIRDLFKRQLDLSGFNTDAFANGQDGLAAISKNAYDLVLLDIMLPDINGLQILQNIRQNPASKNIAVVLLTNLGQDAIIKQGFELGADGYLVKAAYTPDQIVQEVKNIMQKKNAQHAAAAQPGAVPPPAAPAATPAQPDAMPSFPGQASAPAQSTPMFPGQSVTPATTPQSTTTPPVPVPDPMAAPASAPIIPSASEVTSLAASEDQPISATPITETPTSSS